jgi:ABC-2 type transport system ATP-binding protein
MRVVAGELLPTGGVATIDGHRSATLMARRLTGYVADPPLAPPELTGLEWLRYLASAGAQNGAERLKTVRSAIEIGMMEEFVGRRIGEYSRGMVQQLALGAATLGDPKVVVLDEVLSGLDPLLARNLRRNIARLASSGRLVLVASHDLSAIEQLATRAVILSNGRIAADLSMASLLGERVVELSLNGGSLASPEWLLQRFRGAVRTGEGIAIPLIEGLSTEQVLEECRGRRVVVAGSRVRYRRLEDILVSGAQTHDR